LKLDEPATCWQAHGDNVNFLEFSRDGGAFFSVSSDDMWVKRWSAIPPSNRSPTPEATWHSPTGHIGGFAIHPEESWLACGNSGNVHHLDAATLQKAWDPMKKSAAGICFHSSGLISAAKWNNGVCLDAARGHPLGEPIIGSADGD